MTNQELDEKVYAAIKRGAQRFNEIFRRCDGAGKPGVGEEPRAIDKSLQRLRKAGKIAYHKGDAAKHRGWFIV